MAGAGKGRTKLRGMWTYIPGAVAPITERAHSALTRKSRNPPRHQSTNPPPPAFYLRWEVQNAKASTRKEPPLGHNPEQGMVGGGPPGLPSACDPCPEIASYTLTLRFEVQKGFKMAQSN